MGLDFTKYIVVDESLLRINDINILRADIAGIKALGWQPKTTMDEMIKIMIDNERTV